MYVDKQAEFSDAQAVTATAISTNVMDLVSNSSGKNPIRDIGTGQDVYLVVTTTVQPTAAGAATVTVTLESDDNVGLTSATVHFTSKTFALADMAPGANMVAIKLPAGNYERYLGVRYTVATGPLTAGNFDAFLTTDVASWRAYDRNYTV
jgi:hypothetical protein